MPYQQEQQLRRVQARRLAQARTFAEDQHALHQQLLALSVEDDFTCSPRRFAPRLSASLSDPDAEP